MILPMWELSEMKQIIKKLKIIILQYKEINYLPSYLTGVISLNLIFLNLSYWVKYLILVPQKYRNNISAYVL